MVHAEMDRRRSVYERWVSGIESIGKTKKEQLEKLKQEGKKLYEYDVISLGEQVETVVIPSDMNEPLEYDKIGDLEVRIDTYHVRLTQPNDMLESELVLTEGMARQLVALLQERFEDGPGNVEGTG